MADQLELLDIGFTCPDCEAPILILCTSLPCPGIYFCINCTKRLRVDIRQMEPDETDAS